MYDKDASIPAMTNIATTSLVDAEARRSSAKMGTEAKKKYGAASRSHAVTGVPYAMATPSESATSPANSSDSPRSGRNMR